eukprot:TRINITY_DN2496_c0_g1_i1.p1 TRINITY_DN2496_c0_g1~~TRINITY_DN2496_c0_g1_i1.p1  ORF type:complete len:345 (+),score=87.31 TRINITY_DN2496_c0_g1_i1:19-1053(+)
MSSHQVPETQKAIGVRRCGGPIEDLQFETIPTPQVTSEVDILVQVKAIALNPVDYKVKEGELKKELKEPLIVGYDAAGVVVKVGSAVKSFKEGDEVYYSGLISRPGSFQQYQLVDFRIVALKPKTTTYEEAASLPLTSITAYEGLVEHLRVEKGKSILVVAGAGGVGSVAIQFAKIFGLHVIATASRPETQEWVKSLGADEVVDHSKGIANDFKSKNLPNVDYVFNTFGEKLCADFEPVVKPLGKVVGINGDYSEETMKALGSFFRKRIEYHQEFMFARPMYNVEPEKQGKLLEEVAQWVDQGKVKPTNRADQKYSWKQIHEAFKKLTDRTTIGKIVLTVDENQ